MPTHIIWPEQIHILKGKEAEEWQKSRRQVEVDLIKRRKIDGINSYNFVVGAYTWTYDSTPIDN